MGTVGEKAKKYAKKIIVLENRDSFSNEANLRTAEYWVYKAYLAGYKEAYNQALDDATEKAKVSLFDWTNDGFKEFKQNSNHYLINDGTYVEIDEQSILKLKK